MTSVRAVPRSRETQRVEFDDLDLNRIRLRCHLSQLRHPAREFVHLQPRGGMKFLQLCQFFKGTLAGKSAQIVRATLCQRGDLTVPLLDTALEGSDLSGNELAAVGNNLLMESASIGKRFLYGTWQCDTGFVVERFKAVIAWDVLGHRESR